MPKTEIDGDQIEDGTVQRKDLDVSTATQSVIRKLTILGTGITKTFTGADDGTGDVEIELDAGGFGTSYYNFSKSGEETTTADGWIQYDLIQTPTVPVGIYIIHFAGRVTNSQKKTLGFQVNWQLDGVTTFTSIFDSFEQPTTSNVYETRSAFKEITVSVEGVVSVQINYGFTIGGGTAKIDNHDLYLFKVAELP